MIILEEKIQEDYQKEIQKISARASGIAVTQDKVTKRKKTEQAAGVEASTVKKVVSSVTTGSGKAVKDCSGKQVTAAFSERSRMLVSFRTLRISEVVNLPSNLESQGTISKNSLSCLMNIVICTREVDRRTPFI